MQRVIWLHWPFAVLATLGLALLLTGLGSDYLWEDEGDTAVLASNILKYGVPKAWDGVTFIDSDRGARDNDDLVMVSHPWVQYDVAAASFLVFGENTFSARLPFALAGWLTILLVYAFVWRTTANRWAAFCAAALMVLSVQFLLYCRQCRNYSLSMLLTCWLFWIFFRMKSARGCALFAVAAILLFHTHPIGIVPVGVLGILTLIYKPFAPQRRWFWLASPAILILTLPWLALARGGYSENTQQVQSVGQFFERVAQYLLECASVTPLIGSIVLLGICLFRSRRQQKKNKTRPGRPKAAALLLFRRQLGPDRGRGVDRERREKLEEALTTRVRGVSGNVSACRRGGETYRRIGVTAYRRGGETYRRVGVTAYRRKSLP